MFGVLGIPAEAFSHGAIRQAGLGLLALAVSAVGLAALPVRVRAVVFLALSVVLFVAELFVRSYGLFALGGLVTYAAGLTMLIEPESPAFSTERSMRASWLAAVPLVLAAAAFVIGLI